MLDNLRLLRFSLGVTRLDRIENRYNYLRHSVRRTTLIKISQNPDSVGMATIGQEMINISISGREDGRRKDRVRGIYVS